jgi:hypothetical protein
MGDAEEAAEHQHWNEWNCRYQLNIAASKSGNLKSAIAFCCTWLIKDMRRTPRRRRRRLLLVGDGSKKQQRQLQRLRRVLQAIFICFSSAAAEFSWKSRNSKLRTQMSPLLPPRTQQEY